MEDLSEKEQIERIRGWWEENGNYVIAGVVLGVGSILGWNYWQSSRLAERMEASTTFEALAEEVAENRVDDAETIAATLYADHAETIYADQARLAMARLYMDQGRDQDAANALRSLIDNGNDERMKLVARLRLAKVLMYQGRAEEVPELLRGFETSGYAPRFQEALGDAYHAMGEYDAAEEAYLAALSADRANQLVDVTLVQMKINDLPLAEAEVPSAEPVSTTAEPETGEAADPTLADEIPADVESDARDEQPE